MCWIHFLSIHKNFGALCMRLAGCQPGPRFSEKPCLKAFWWRVLAQGIWCPIAASAQGHVVSNTHVQMTYTVSMNTGEAKEHQSMLSGKLSWLAIGCVKTLYTAKQTLQSMWSRWQPPWSVMRPKSLTMIALSPEYYSLNSNYYISHS